jgi:5,10-methylenetetrahydromethanopterin reductase
MNGMRIGVGIGDGGGGLDAALAQIARAEAAGFHSAWLSNIFAADAMTLAAIAGRATTRIELGTAVVPTHSRHPFYMAQQAVTTQLACGGRFALGIGPSHRVVIENMLGLSFEKPARHMREYVRVLGDLLRTGKTGHRGEVYQVNAALGLSAPQPPAILIGALQPRMLKLAGELCDGTLTWMTGARALGEQVVPQLTAAAREADRPAPRVVCALPITLTDDVAGAREAAARAFSAYGGLPSYRAMLELERASGPGDVLLAGDADTLEGELARLRSAGVTDFSATIFAHGADREAAAARTYAWLSDLARR